MIRIRRRIRRLFLSLFYRKLWVRIAVIMLVIVTIPVVLLGILLINTSYQAVRNSVLNNYQQLVIRTSEEIGLFVRRPQDILNTTAAMLGVIYPASWKQETVLVELVLEQPIFMRAASVDISGTLLASSELGRGLAWNYPREALEAAIKTGSYFSPVKLLDNHTPYVTLAVPIKKMNTTMAILIADVNLRGMWDIVDNIRIGTSGRAFLVSSEGVLIAHPDKKRVLSNENFKNRKEVQSVLAGKTEAIELEDKTEGKLISAYAPIKGLGWGVVLRQNQDEAYLFSKVMKMQSWIIIVLSELVAIVASILMGRMLVRPIKVLVLRIKSVAGGDLDNKIKVRMRDDIGELVRSFNEMTKKLKRARDRERLSAIGEAVAWIVHELKNSLISIKTFVQLFPTRHKDDNFVDKFNRLVPQEINRLEGIFKELADFSAHYDLKKSQTNIRFILENTLEIMHEQCSNKKIDIKYEPGKNSIFLQADPEKLKQVFMNLIINAISAMPEGGLLSVSLDSGGTEDSGGAGHLEVVIRDTGRGMPKEVQDKLFEPFHTTKNGGMGLGLTISRKIIQQHGGNIEVSSQIDKGTSLIVKLPFEHYLKE